MTQQDPLSLDDHDESEDSPEYPQIPAWTVEDPYSRTKLSVSFSEESGPELTISAGNPTDGPYQVMRMDLVAKSLAELVNNHIAPLLAWERRQEDFTTNRQQEDEARRRATADASAWRARYKSVDGVAQEVVHRSDCPISKKLGAKIGERTHGGTDDGQAFLRLLDRVEKALTALIGEDQVASKQRQALRAKAGSIRGTKMDRRPLVLCLRCEPLGESTATVMDQITELAHTTRVDPAQEAALTDLMVDMRTLVWQVEQEHLDALRGNS